MMNNSYPQTICAVDLFCGIGGLTYGLREAGITVKAGVDIDSSCRYAYETNNPNAKFIEADIRDIEYADIRSYYEGADITVLVGCAPCQPFSAHTRKYRASSKEDDCLLVKEFIRLIKEGKPDIISMENVPGLIKHTVFFEFINVLETLGYKFNYKIVSCLDYGVPQTRRRLVLLASALDTISLASKTGEKPIVEDFIKGIPAIRHGEISPTDSAHTSLRLSEMNFRRIQQSKPGGTWKDWDSKLVSACHQNKYYPAPYGRMSWDKPAPTITTQFCYYSTGRFGHPQQDRAISVREAALLQTFPKSYQLTPNGMPIIIKDIARHIGNAVPVKLAKSIGKSIMEKYA